MLRTPSTATSPRPSPLPTIDRITSMTPSTSRKMPMITAIVTSDGPGQAIRMTPAARVSTPEDDEQPPQAAEILQGVGDVRGHTVTSAGVRASGRNGTAPTGRQLVRARRPAFTRPTLSSTALRRRIDSGDLDALVLAQELERLVERQDLRGHQALQHVGRGRAHVRQVLLADRVDVEILGAAVLADDHALVELVAGGDEQRAALLQRGQREPGGLAGAVGHERSARSGAQLAEPRLPPVEDVVDQAGSARLGEELRPEADEAAGGDAVLHPHPHPGRG